MKVKELIEQLQGFDPELEVQVFHDMGSVEINNVSRYVGEHEDPNNIKLIYKTIFGQFVGIGNPSNYQCSRKFTLV